MGTAIGDGRGLVRSLESAGPAGRALAQLIQGLVSLYFPEFLLDLGSMSPIWALFGWYLLIAAAFALRRAYVRALVVLVVPLACTWLLSAFYLGEFGG